MSGKRRMLAGFLFISVSAWAGIAFIGQRAYWLGSQSSDEAQYDGKSTSFWIEALQESDVDKRRAAMANLGAIGSEARSAVPALAHIMRNDEDPAMRANAALALYHIGGPETVPDLIHGLDDDFEWVRMNCALALAQAGPSASDAVPALLASVSSPKNRGIHPAFHVSIRQESIVALGRIGSAAKDAVPRLTEALADSDVQTRLRAVIALGRIGTAALVAVPQILLLLKEDDEMIREMAGESLMQISPSEAAKAGIRIKD